MVEKRTNIKVEDYVDFGDKGSAEYKLYTEKDFCVNYFYIGEMNQNNKPHGRCIQLYSGLGIFIQRYKDDKNAPGNEITIWSVGSIDVGEYFRDANGEIKNRSTGYITFGTTTDNTYKWKIEEIRLQLGTADISEELDDNDSDPEAF